MSSNIWLTFVCSFRNYNGYQCCRPCQDGELVGRSFDYGDGLFSTWAHFPTAGQGGRCAGAGWSHGSSSGSFDFGGTGPHGNSLRNCVGGASHRNGSTARIETILRETRIRFDQYCRHCTISEGDVGSERGDWTMKVCALLVANDDRNKCTCYYFLLQ